MGKTIHFAVAAVISTLAQESLSAPRAEQRALCERRAEAISGYNPGTIIAQRGRTKLIISGSAQFGVRRGGGDTSTYSALDAAERERKQAELKFEAAYLACLAQHK